MDTCVLCQDPLGPDDKRMEYACGCHTVHSACGLRGCVRSARETGLFRCATCGTTLFDLGYGYIEEPGTPTPPGDIPKKDIQALKQKQANANKSLKTFKTYFQEQYNTYKDQVTPSIEHIRMAQQYAITTIKASEEYKAAQTSDNTLNSAITRFKHKYNLDFDEFAKMKILQRNRGRGWYLHKSHPLAYIKYRFRTSLYPK
jgi:hypothetical protein